MVKDGFSEDWTDSEVDLLHWRKVHPDENGAYRESRVKIRIDLDEESQAVIVQEDGKSCLHIPIETTAECHMYIPDTFSDGSGKGSGRTHLVVYLNDGDAWAERNRDDGSFTKKNIRNLEKSSWNLMESMDFSAASLHLEKDKEYRLWPKRIGYWTNLEDDQWDNPPIQGQNRFKIQLFAEINGQGPQEIHSFVLT